MNENSFLVFVVEDNEWYNKLLVHSLSLNPSFIVKSFMDGKSMLAEIGQNPAAITVDYNLPDMNGIELIQKVKKINPAIEIVAISEQEEIETALKLLKAGAYDYLVKSKDIKERLLHTIQHIYKNTDLKNTIQSLQKEVANKYTFEKTIIGQSDAIKKVYNLIDKATQTNITVTLTGETGTGKEVVAKAIHFNSNRKSAPFIAINMAAIPSDLLESELFGHEKGAFTGASMQRKGKFEEANNGTLFLDEIGEMDLNAQVKLLRALQEKEITRVGSNVTIPTNCRIIVATNRNLIEDVKEGKFREDLYYRLFGLPIHLPPLRERDNDVLILSQHFLKLFCKENDIEVKKLDSTAKQKLSRYVWPGNIRELKSIIELACVISNSNVIFDEDIQLATNKDLLPDLMVEEISMREYNQRIVLALMKKYNNDTKLVAQKLDIGQTTVYRLINETKEEV